MPAKPRWLLAIDDDWTPTPENINALPDPLRRYIHQLETVCDPAGDQQELALARDTIGLVEAEQATALFADPERNAHRRGAVVHDLHRLAEHEVEPLQLDGPISTGP